MNEPHNEMPHIFAVRGVDKNGKTQTSRTYRAKAPATSLAKWWAKNYTNVRVLEFELVCVAHYTVKES